MSYQIKLDNSRIFKNLLLLLVITFFSSSISIAQEEQKEETPASLYNAGYALLKEKKYEDGYTKLMEALEKAIAQNEDESLAEAIRNNNDKVISKAKSNGALAAYSSGNTKLKAKEYEAALEYYNSGIELNPSYSSNYIGKGKVFNAQGEKLAAVEAYMMAASKAEENGKTKKVDEAYKRAKLIVGKLYAAKKYEDAIATGNKVLENKELSEVLYYVSRCQTELNDYESALATAEKAIEVGTATETLEDKFYIAKGLALEGLNKKSEAIAAYKMVKEGDYVEQAEYKIQQLSSK